MELIPQQAGIGVLSIRGKRNAWDVGRYVFCATTAKQRKSDADRAPHVFGTFWLRNAPGNRHPASLASIALQSVACIGV